MENSFKQFLIENLYTDDKENDVLYLDYENESERDFLLEKLEGKVDVENVHGLYVAFDDDLGKRLILSFEYTDTDFVEGWKFKNFVPFQRIEQVDGIPGVVGKIVSGVKPIK